MSARNAGLALAAAALLALAGCRIASFGPRVDDFELTHSGRGITTRIMLQDRATIDGELLALQDDDGLLLLTAEPAILSLPWRAVRHARFPQLRVEVSHGRAPDARDRETLRRVSRHPEGLDDARLRTLLDAYGLAEVREVTP